MELKIYLEVLARRWRIILVVAILVIGLAAVGSRFVSPKYEAVTVLRIVTPLGGRPGDVNYQTTFATRLVNTYAQIAVSGQVKNELKERLGLQSLPDITVKIIPDSEILQIVVESESSALAAKAANTLADILLSYQSAPTAAIDSTELDILAARKQELQTELAEAQQQHDQLVQIYSQTAAEMTVLNRTIQLKEASYQNLQNQYEQVVVEEAVFTNSTVRATRDALAREIARIEEELGLLNQQYKVLSAKFNEYQQQVTLARQTIQGAQSAYADLLSQYDDVTLANSRQENAQNVEIVSPAFDPLVPSGPGRSFVLGLGVICGLIAGIVMAFVVDNLDTRIFSIEQAERITSHPVLGSISKSAENRRGEQGATVNRDYWMLRAKLRKLFQETPIKTLMIASPNRGEGKSTLLFRLALSLAQGQSRVLVVDADLRKPQQHKLFNVVPQHGLSDFLQGKTDNVNNLIMKDVRPGIDLIPSLAEFEDPAELLQSRRWETLLEAIRSFDLVLFDSPAFLAVPDVLDLAKLVDGVLVIAQWGHTPSEDIRAIYGHLEIIGANIAGLIVNQSPPRKDAGYYYQAEKGLFHGRSKKAIPRSS